MRNKKFKILIVVLSLTVIVSLVVAGVTYFYPKYQINKYYEAEADDIDSFNKYIQRIASEEQTADNSANDLESDDADITTSYGGKGWYKSDSYSGEIRCVLHIPSIGLEKAVYKGDDNYNLEHYLLIEGLPDMTIGQSCYLIFGHDSKNMGASFSRLHELAVGDEVMLTCDLGQLNYNVVAVDSVLSDDVINLINYDDPNALYLVTCEKKKLKGESDYRRRVLSCMRK